jgi:uncharacterized membrane protein affecting hemolysin expression
MADPGVPILDYQRPRPRRRWWPFVAAVALAMGVFVGVGWWRVAAARAQERRLLQQAQLNQLLARQAAMRAATQPAK